MPPPHQDIAGCGGDVAAIVGGGAMVTRAARSSSSWDSVIEGPGLQIGTGSDHLEVAVVTGISML
jgi:hypothetical protein